MMSKKQGFVFYYVCMNTIMCIFMALAGLLVNVGFVTLPMYVDTLIKSLIICNLSTLIFRIPKMGISICMLLSGGKPESKAFGFWAGLVNPTLNSLFMNTFMTLLNVGVQPAYFAAWLHGFLPLELVSLVVSFVAAPFARKIAMKF